MLGRPPLQHTDLALLRLCNDDLPGLNGGGGAGGLLALLLPLDLDGGGLLSQREVVLDGLGRSHRLAHLLLWGEGEAGKRKRTDSAAARVNFHSSPQWALCSCLLNAELSTFEAKGKWNSKRPVVLNQTQITDSIDFTKHTANFPKRKVITHHVMSYKRANNYCY